MLCTSVLLTEECRLCLIVPMFYSQRMTHSARNLGFIFDEHLTFSDQICALSKSCYYHIRELRCLRPYLDFKTASTIATSIVHSKLDYCNSQGPSRFSPWSSTVYLVHHPSQYSYFVTFFEPPPLCRRHTTFLLFLSISF